MSRNVNPQFTSEQNYIRMEVVARIKRPANPGEVGRWLLGKMLDWQREQGERKTVEEFADYLGVKRGTVNQWLNGARKPKGAYVRLIADKFGPEIYDLLGLARPDFGASALEAIIRLLTPDKKAELEKIARGMAEETKRAKEKATDV